RALRARQLDGSSEREQGRSRVPGEGGPAHPAARRHMTDGAVFLDATAERLAPEARLIVVNAPGVQTQVAAERAHVPEQRTRNGLGRLVQHGIIARDDG